MTVRLSPRWKKTSLSPAIQPHPQHQTQPRPPTPTTPDFCLQRERERERGPLPTVCRIETTIKWGCFHHCCKVLFFSLSFPIFHICLFFFSLLVSLCALTVKHQRIIGSAILKYECALIFAVSLSFYSLWHLRGISGWFCARLSPSHYRGAGSIDSTPSTDAFLALIMVPSAF